MVVVCNESPSTWQFRLDFQALLLAPLWLPHSPNCQAAIVDPKVRVVDRRAFKRLGAQRASFQCSACTHTLRSQRGVKPRLGSPVESVAERKTLPRTVPYIRDQKSGLPHFAPGW